jgi:hypothetical protein
MARLFPDVRPKTVHKSQSFGVCSGQNGSIMKSLRISSLHVCSVSVAATSQGLNKIQ